jgi:hypothetical protein
LEHLEEILKVINRKPRKLSQLNDISRIKDIFTLEEKGDGSEKGYCAISRVR